MGARARVLHDVLARAPPNYRDRRSRPAPSDRRPPRRDRVTTRRAGRHGGRKGSRGAPQECEPPDLERPCVDCRPCRHCSALRRSSPNFRARSIESGEHQPRTVFWRPGASASAPAVVRDGDCDGLPASRLAVVGARARMRFKMERNDLPRRSGRAQPPQSRGRFRRDDVALRRGLPDFAACQSRVG